MLIEGKRAIAYFDILGFKSKINNTPIEILSKEYESIIAQTDGSFYVENGQIAKREACHRFIFSDSIFLIAKDDTEESFIDMFSYAWRMVQMFIAKGFPLRGAFTYGEVYANFDTMVFLGKAISAAVILEGLQNWIGAVIDDSIIERYKSMFSQNSVASFILSILMPKYAVPLKDGSYQNYYTLNWRLNMVSQDGIKSLFKNIPYDETVQRKIDNTLAYSKEIRNTKMSHASGDNLPQKFAPFYIGHSTPTGNKVPFHDGDEY